MATQAQITAAQATVQTDINAKSADGSITKVNVGDNIKAAMDLTLSPYKSYAPVIRQTSTGAPTVDALMVNELGGTPVYARTGVGTYTLTITGAFTLDKTWFTPKEICTNASVPDDFAYNVSINRVDANVVSIDTFLNGAPADGVLQGLPIEIRVYN